MSTATTVDVDQRAHAVTHETTDSSVKVKPLWREYLETGLLALLAAVLLRLLVVSAYRVSSASMEGALYEGDYLFVNKLAYYDWWSNGPQIGDIIAFKYPNNPTKDFVKRVVALPGQTVQVVDKVVYVDGEVAWIPPLSKNIDSRVLPGELSFRDNFGPYTVPVGEYFVLGDNRDDSRDSRFWGSVPAENIRGRTEITYFSVEPGSWWSFPVRIRWSRIGSWL